MPELYEELLRLARGRLARSRCSTILSAPELVHEVYVRLAKGRPVDFAGRRHFFFVAARTMRDILVEKSRRQACQKRGGDTEKIALHTLELAEPTLACGLVLDLALALERLESEDSERAQVVRLSYFEGLTHRQIAATLSISRATVERRWACALDWLRRHLSSPCVANA